MSSKYAFAGQVIRLNQRDLDQWRKTFHGILDIDAELAALDAWYATELTPEQQKKWFARCSATLAKKHQAALVAAKNVKPPEDEFDKWMRVQEERNADWRYRVRRWLDDPNSWDDYNHGQPPDSPTTVVPAKVLAEFGLGKAKKA